MSSTIQGIPISSVHIDFLARSINMTFDYGKKITDYQTTLDSPDHCFKIVLRARGIKAPIYVYDSIKPYETYFEQNDRNQEEWVLEAIVITSHSLYTFCQEILADLGSPVPFLKQKSYA